MILSATKTLSTTFAEPLRIPGEKSVISNDTDTHAITGYKVKAGSMADKNGYLHGELNAFLDHFEQVSGGMSPAPPV